MLFLQGKRVALSGSGNVATYAVEKLLELGAIPVTMSDSAGYVYWKDGITTEQLQAVMHLKNVTRGRLSDLKDAGAWTSNNVHPSTWSLSPPTCLRISSLSYSRIWGHVWVYPNDVNEY